VCGECAPRNIEDDGRKKALELDKLVRTKTDVGKKNDGDLGVNPFFLLPPFSTATWTQSYTTFKVTTTTPALL
jgi:hypothetical protein